jgi:hypothetical protein
MYLKLITDKNDYDFRTFKLILNYKFLQFNVLKINEKKKFVFR